MKQRGPDAIFNRQKCLASCTGQFVRGTAQNIIFVEGQNLFHQASEHFLSTQPATTLPELMSLCKEPNKLQSERPLND